MPNSSSTDSAAPLLPAHPNLVSLRQAAATCQACPLWKTGTRTVFGEGSETAKIVLVGEQPGDREDLAGRPFVGPAGRLLDETLQAAGIDRSTTYVTNAVKHFKWTPAGKRRLHKKPNARETAACRPWLEAELDVLQPEIVVALGATAAQALMGRTFRVTQSRGQLLQLPDGTAFLATVHPSSVLRAPSGQRQVQQERLVDDLRVVAQWLQQHRRAHRTG